jgi:hypothetical protein
MTTLTIEAGRRQVAAPLVERTAVSTFTDWLDHTLPRTARLLIAIAGLALAAVFARPMWHIRMYATQFPDGLELQMYPHKLTGGNEGRDVREINTLNHYIGMRPLEQQDFAEMRWIPFAVGAFALLALRCAVFGKVRGVVDLLVLFTYFGVFSLGTFYYRLYTYGHQLDPEAPIKVAPFTPPLIGHHTLANFEVYSFPGFGSYVFLVFGTLLAALLAYDWFVRRRRATA